MKIRSMLYAAVVAILAAAPTQAATTINLGPVAPGTNMDIFSSDVGPGIYQNTINGSLSAHESATFTYTLTGANALAGVLSGVATGGPDTSSSTAFLNNAPINSSSALVLTTASLTGSANSVSGLLTITNNSLGIASFSSVLLAVLGAAGQLVIHLSSVSNVPLPASAMLFGLGLALVAGFGLMKKKQMQA